MIRFFIILALFFLSPCALAQAFFRTESIVIEPGDSISLSPYEPFSAICFEGPGLNGLSLISEAFGVHAIVPDPHHGENRSQLFTFPKEHGALVLISSGFSGSLRILFIDQGEAPVIFESHQLLKKSSCDKPAVIPPEVWRAGLPDPKPGRTFNQVKHMIIHHSAGSNFNTNYTEVVRSIYLLHINTNNWDDIGYNYCIAANGVIYAGRDPLDLREEDEVTGAHFCGKNTGTMGTCILGTYTDTLPSEASMESLHALLLWKLAKDHVGPADSFPHPRSSDPLLPVVAGHRDGCNTACPGNELHKLIPALRLQLEKDWKLCPKIAETVFAEKPAKPTIYPNPIPTFVNTLQVNFSGEWQLYSAEGLFLENGKIEHHEIRLSSKLASGLYYIRLQNPSVSQVEMIFKL